jgi:hypothetical protein
VKDTSLLTRVPYYGVIRADVERSITAQLHEHVEWQNCPTMDPLLPMDGRGKEGWVPLCPGCSVYHHVLWIWAGCIEAIDYFMFKRGSGKMILFSVVGVWQYFLSPVYFLVLVLRRSHLQGPRSGDPLGTSEVPSLD